jgi:hypothetical protein
LWYFQDGYGHTMTIAVSALPCAYGVCDANLVVWHYTKDSCAGYWNPRTPAQCASAKALDELWFVLHHDPDGAWRCIGFNYIDYLAVRWKVQILAPPGMAPPYTIIPVDSFTGDPETGYNAIVTTMASTWDPSSDFSAPTGPVNFSTTWRTDADSEVLAPPQGRSWLTIPLDTLFSDQHEGCVHEHWNFAPGYGLFRVVPIIGLGDDGACLNMDPALTMIQFNPPGYLGPPVQK